MGQMAENEDVSFKVDFDKVFNSLNLGFLDDLLYLMNFRTKWSFLASPLLRSKFLSTIHLLRSSNLTLASQSGLVDDIKDYKACVF